MIFFSEKTLKSSTFSRQKSDKGILKSLKRLIRFFLCGDQQRENLDLIFGELGSTGTGFSSFLKGTDLTDNSELAKL